MVDIDVDVAKDDDIMLFPLDFTFQSPSDKYHEFSAGCSQPGHCGTGIFSHPVAVYQTVPIEPDDFTIDSIEAAKIAQRHGGEKFVKRKAVSMFVKLERRGPTGTPGKGPVLWRASYLDLATGEELNIYIDAKTGEVVGTRP
ncbi:MAG: hypothetical protein GXP38_15150 [Chloroflexi bacterium]|nr:hypothetical protein [Chloroflexota bacterium]